ncbi:ParB/RepB/Spo0J family partition protein (plasmid) [Pseudomonas aeruginosa]|uniref:ParB/RepB/Spo0J family partition protein n=1 Tax=Pseudomonas aeruginosa TaxID=287 RepID=UPI0021C02F09|nr:ParB/RepB/Spo0J family partition protein [Pseudomonas aeruginosa]UXH55916.1 ParB/RepB/Spo0J family partition protein [Pseudomonas aeruginosa]UXH68960.1 ParB/RepB/Spo0J family partition protein [Pseudomonas aeruginosa]
MPKEPRPLGKKDAPKVFQGVPVRDTFPTPNLNVSIDDILASQDEDRVPLEPEAETHNRTLPSSTPSAQLQEVPVDLIDDPLFQPRLGISDEEQERNTTAIAVAGRVNRPLLLRLKDNGRYELIGGATRLRSVRSLGWPTVPARIVDVDDAEAEILAVTDNEGHKDLTDFEKGRSYSRILATGKIKTAKTLADRTGSSAPTVNRCLAFMKLPPACIKFLEQNPATLGVKHVSEFVDIGQSHPDLVLDALTKIEQEGISQEVALRWIKGKIHGQPGDKAHHPAPTSFSFGQLGAATMVRRKDSISLKLPKGADLEAVEAAILKALGSVSDS